MKIPLRVERQDNDLELFENVEKVLKYKITNDNRFLVKDIDISAKTIKENGEDTFGKYVKSIKGIKPRLMPKDSCVIRIYVKLDKEYKETILINNKEELSTLDLDIKAVGTLVIAKPI